MRRISRIFERPPMVLVLDDFEDWFSQLAALEGVPIVTRHQTMDCLARQMLCHQNKSYMLL
jgi:hypothetical protein